jgi:heme-degrading monooxygenase HmoA
MVVVLSRFRVANGMQQDVRHAFLSRPGLVDDAHGFLGLEVFTDSCDPAVFYLFTRWTDAESYRTWHRSEQHHESHRGIPKGLKLEASFTQVLVLEPIDGGLR